MPGMKHLDALALVRSTDAVTALTHEQAIAIYLRATGALADGAPRLSDPIDAAFAPALPKKPGARDPGTFGSRLMRLRADKMMTQFALAKNLGKSRSTVAQWERGASRPYHDDLKKLAKIFQVSIDYLIEGALA